jgi:hypothetical protein
MILKITELEQNLTKLLNFLTKKYMIRQKNGVSFFDIILYFVCFEHNLISPGPN